MGFPVQCADLNPVAVLLNKCNLELIPAVRSVGPVNPDAGRRALSGAAISGAVGLAEDLLYYGAVIRQRAEAGLARSYPRVELPKEHGGREAAVLGWIWFRTVASPNPAVRGKHVPLASTLMLSTRKGRMTRIRLITDETAPHGWRSFVESGQFTSDEVSAARLGTRIGRNQDFRCLISGEIIARAYVQSEGKAGRLGLHLAAVVADGGRGKIYLTPTADQDSAASVEDPRLADARLGFLSGELPTRAEITGGVCTAYGLNTWGQLFSNRQLVSLITLSDLIQDIEPEVLAHALASGMNSEDAAAYAKAVLTFLALSLDRCADFNNVLCRWKASGEQSLQLFSKQALPMVWDFFEPNILGVKAVSWATAVQICSEAIKTVATEEQAKVSQQDAANLTDIPDGILVSTDPPYYNNISYARLSDFFYVWLRRTLGREYPDIFATVLTPKAPELIAAADRFGGSRHLAKDHFESGFKKAFASVQSKMDHRFPLTVYYAFKQDDEDSAEGEEGESTTLDLTTGWETLLEALLSSGFQITATWPVRASQKWRMVSMGTNALASYIVLACRPRSADAQQTDRRSFVAELKRELPAALRHLQQGNIAPVDFAQAAIGPGMAVYSQYLRVLESSGKPMSVRAALSVINQTLTEVLSEQEDDFEGDTRWAISWFEQKGFAEGDFGEAELLSKAKVTSVSGLQQAGVIQSKGGKVRLLRPDELSSTWDPATDKRLTIWEMTHQLVRVYYHEKAGDEAAGRLLAQMGSNAEIARELAYRLFDICEKKKRSAEAQAYNALVLGWPEIAHFAREAVLSQPQQPRLIGEE